MNDILPFIVGFGLATISYALGYKDGQTYRKEVQSELITNNRDDISIDKHKCRLALKLYEYTANGEVSGDNFSAGIKALNLNANEVKYVINELYGKLGQ